MIFGSIADEATKSGQAITIFRKKISDVISDYKSAETGKYGEKKFASAFSGMFGVKNKDIDAIKHYNSLIESGIPKTEAFAQSMSNASVGARNLVQNSETATIDIKALSVSEKVAAVNAKLLGTALNMALTFGVGLLISSIVDEINKLINAEKEAKEKADDLRSQAVQTADSYKSEAESLSSLYSEYLNIVSKTTDLTNEKEKLLEIQDKVNEGIKSEREQIDLLNDSLSDNIEWINKRSYAEAKNTIRDLGGEYQEALRFMEQGALTFEDKKELYYDSLIERVQAIIGKDNLKILENKTGGQIGFAIDSGKGIEKNIELMDKLISEYSDYLAAAKDTSNYNMYKNEYDIIKKISDEYKEQYSQYSKIIKSVEVAQNTIHDYEASFGTDTSKRINEILESVKDLSVILNSDSSSLEKYNAVQQIKDLKEEAYSLAGTNTLLKDNIDSVFSAFDSGTISALGNISDLDSAWFESLDEMQKGTLANVDKIKSAMQSLAEGEQLSSGDFWDLMKLDTDKIVTDIQMVGDKYVVSQEQLIKLKDQIIQKELESLKIEREKAALNAQDAEQLVATLEAQKAAWKFAEKPLTNIQYRKEYDELNARLEQAKTNAREYGNEVSRDIILEKQLTANLGDTVDVLKALTAQQKQLNNEISALNKQLDNYVNAYNAIIDSRIDSLQDEVDVLEDQKGILEDELNVLNEQKENIEQIISNYETANNFVQKTIQKEIDALNEQKKAIEDTYNARIDALKAENDEREDALEYAQKLANLENAKNNKVRVIDATRGFRYESVKEDVVKAESELKSFETEQEIKSIEKERDTLTKAIEDTVKEKETYLKEWSEALDTIKSKEDEILAAEILGEEWREQISTNQLGILERFNSKYEEYTGTLKNLVNGEIKLKNESIDAKNKEIDAKKKQITAWQNYKTQVSSAIQTLRGDNAEYKAIIEELERTEPLTLETRGTAFENFKTRVSGYITEIGNKQGVLDNITSTIDSLSGGDYQFNFEVNNLDVLKETRDVIEDIAAAAGYLSVTSMSSEELQNKWITDSDFTTADYVQELLRRAGRSHADGGVADYTGLAMLHGRKNAPETIFNANDSAKLYEMVHNTPNLMADMIDKATKISGFNLANASNNTQNSNEYSFYIDKIVTDNPQDFAKQLDRYYQTKLTESYTNK